MEKQQKKRGFLKYLFVGIVMLILVILSKSIKSQVYDRNYTSNQAAQSIAEAAGGSFYSEGWFVSIPYSSNDSIYQKEGYVNIYAKNISYDADITSENKKLGIFSAPVFNGTIKSEGIIDISGYKSVKNVTYHLDEAKLIFNINDTSLVERPVFFINDKQYQTDYDSQDNGVACNIDLRKVDSIRVSSLFNIRGASKFSIGISSNETQLNVKSNWVSPGFTNFSYLPNTSNINENGFSAKWNVPFDSGDRSHKIGFSFVESVNLYSKLLRSVSYSFLFILVPFIVLFLFEVFAKINLHPLNYLLCGAASVLFFLLLLSISEHISFGLSYMISALASGLLISLYIFWITNKYKFSFGMAVIFALLYLYLYFCLKSEDYALLMGSIFAFTMLAFVMFITRKIDWENLKKTSDTEIIES